MFEPMASERREQIRAALEPLPAYPWKWWHGNLESADVNPQMLIAATHSGAPEFLAYDPTIDGMVLNTARVLANRGIPNVVGDWIENGAKYAEELLFDNERLARDLEEAQTSLDRAAGREHELLNEIGQLKAEIQRLRNNDHNHTTN